jgi:hypothetical protein
MGLGSRGQKGTGSRIRIRNTGFRCCLSFHEEALLLPVYTCSLVVEFHSLAGQEERAGGGAVGGELGGARSAAQALHRPTPGADTVGERQALATGQLVQRWASTQASRSNA